MRPDLAADMQGNRSDLAFGSGPHERPGQDIGRAIAEVGVDALLMRLPDLELDVDDEDLLHAESIASRHLIELPVQFMPRPPQEVTQQPNHDHRPAPRPNWHIGAPEPEQQAAPSPAARPEPFGHHDVPAPQPAGPVAEPAAAAEPARPLGAGERILRWWRDC